MDLFVMNRYLGDGLEENQNKNEQKHQLSKLLSKIDERKRLKTSKQDGSETVSTKYKSPGKEVGSGNKSENKEIDTKLDQQTPSIKLKGEKHKAGTVVDGYTILGTHRFGKKKKVKRVLPKWLANPTIISTNLQKLTTSVEDVPGIDEDIVQKLKENNITQFFPVQSHVIPYLLSAHNKPRYYWPSDVCVSSPTGSGKTLAFVIPIVQALKKRVVIHIRALVVLPVQDLAIQVYEVFKKKNINDCLHPPPLSVSTLQWYRPPTQKLLFSATLSQDPEKLHQLALFQPKLFTSVINESSEIGENIEMSNEIRGDFIGKYTTPLELSEQFCVVEAANKPTLLYHLIKSNGWKHVLCFTNTRTISHRLSLLLKHLGEGEIKVAEISTALKRAERNQILSHFAAGKIDVLVSTDAFARGMDILDVKFVISFDPPKYVKNYIHRVGRTGRAGKVGNAITFILESQRGHFTEMLQEAGKVVKELTVPSKDLEYLTSHSKKALVKLNQVLEEEKNKSLKSMKFKKKHKFSGGYKYKEERHEDRNKGEDKEKREVSRRVFLVRTDQPTPAGLVGLGTYTRRHYTYTHSHGLAAGVCASRGISRGAGVESRRSWPRRCSGVFAPHRHRLPPGSSASGRGVHHAVSDASVNKKASTSKIGDTPLGAGSSGNGGGKPRQGQRRVGGT
uniref:ATP-dependent RNA helicase n=1 Tax=Timema tahoe TaxID=61484 RepID=A0A7R9NXU1_9NEOP|nr:unnamed protein product [Timema tahoe]